MKKNAFFNRVASQVREKFGIIGVLSGERMAAYGGSGPKQGHHFNAMLLSSVTLAGHAPVKMYLKFICHNIADIMLLLISLMSKVIFKTCWLNLSKAATPTIPGYV